MFLRKSEESQRSLFVTVCEYHLRGSCPRSVYSFVLHVSICAHVLQVSYGHFEDDSEQPNEYLGLEIFFFFFRDSILVMLKSPAIPP